MLGSKRTDEFVPLEERAFMLEWFRGGLAALVVAAWLAIPTTRGMSLSLLAGGAAAYVIAMSAIQRLWLRAGGSLALFVGVAAMADATALAAASYMSAGVDTPVYDLLLVQLIVVSLIGSFRLGLKLALFQIWMVLTCTYLQELGVNALGGEDVPFGGTEFRTLVLKIVVALLVAGVTTGFAAVNERELRRRRGDMEDLAELTMKLEDAGSPSAIGDQLLAGIDALHGCEAGLVVRRAADGDLTAIAVRGVANRTEGGPLRAEAAPVVSAAIESRCDALVVHRAADGDALLAPFPDGTRLALVPLPIDEAGATLIVAQPASAGARMRRRTLGLLGRYAAHAAIVMRNAELLEKVRALATTDGLTGLPNRRHLDDALDRACAQAARGHGSLGVLMIDVDKFKVLNDTHGHQKGDEVLKHVAKVLDAELRAGDMVARYGGEEFTVVMPGAKGIEVEGAAERLRCAIEISDGPLPVTVSVGVAWATEHGITRETLVSAADRALYEAKQSGRNRVAVAERTAPRLVADVG